jgi:hypothetical protein
VVVPPAERERDTSRAGFDQSTGDEEMLHQLRPTVVSVFGIAFAISLDQLWVFVLQVQRLQ